MEEFLKLKWRIEGPHEIEDYDSEFIPEEEIKRSYIYNQTFLNTIAKPINVEKANVLEKQHPINKYKLKSQIKSFLNTKEQSSCLKALHMVQMGKKAVSVSDKQCIELYNNVQQQIAEENKKFLEFAKKKFLSKSVKAGFTKPIKSYADLILKKQVERSKDYPQYYKEIDTLLYSYREDETPIEMIHLANLLEVGTLAKFTRPTLLTPYHVPSYNFPNTFDTFNSNLPVSKDVIAKRLLETHDAEIVISSSGLKKLLNFTDTNCSWDIPVIVESLNFTKNDGTSITRNVVFIDKPFPNTTPNEVEIIERTLKLGLKANFCTLEGLKYSEIEEPLNTRSEDINLNNKKNKKRLAMLRDAVSNHRKVYHNATYRVWHLRQENKQSGLMKTSYKMKDVKVLIRCKLDACEAIENSILQPLSLHPKLEHQPEFGASIPTKAELISQWASLFFRPFSQICRMRIACASKEVLMLENCNIQKINNEFHTHYNYKPSLGLGVLYKLFLELKTLSPGNYLLHHLPKHGSFVSLLQSSQEKESYDLYQCYNIDNWDVTKKDKGWCPIDCNLVLPKHIALDQMPGLFPPNNNLKPQSSRQNKFKNKKRKPKIKINKLQKSN